MHIVVCVMGGLLEPSLEKAKWLAIADAPATPNDEPDANHNAMPATPNEDPDTNHN